MTAIMPGVSTSLTTSLQYQLTRVVSDWTPQQGIQETAIDGVELVRSDGPTSCGSSVYEPSLIFVIQGTKTIRLGDRKITYDPMTYLASSVHLPVVGRIIDATPEHPYLAGKAYAGPSGSSRVGIAAG